jgi:hypothetical protein
MRIIELDASGCTTVLSFYDALLAAIEAPHWHGHSIDALIDSMVWGDINGIEGPYRIHVTGSRARSAEVQAEILLIAQCLMEGRADHSRRGRTDMDVALEVIS